MITLSIPLFIVLLFFAAISLFIIVSAVAIIIATKQMDSIQKKGKRIGRF